jgi:hypothetical protein
MALAPDRSRESRVGDLSYQHVLERELSVAGDLGTRLAADEVACLERVDDVVQAVAAIQTQQRSAPEDLAGHGRVQKHSPLRRRQCVEASGDDAPNGSRQLTGRQPTGLRQRSA